MSKPPRKPSLGEQFMDTFVGFDEEWVFAAVCLDL